MFRAYFLALAQLSDGAVRGAVWRAFFIAVLAVVLLWAGAAWALPLLAVSGMPWLDTLATMLGWAGVALLSWILFPGVASAGVAFFLEDVAAAVEARHFPNLAPARAPRLGEMAWATTRFLAVVVAVNLLILPFLFVPPVFPFVFYPANGYLLGREYFELVAARRIDDDEARALAKRYRWPLWAAGMIAAGMLTVPLLNLLAPVVATAAMVHLFHQWRSAEGSDAGRGSPEKPVPQIAPRINGQ